MVKASNTQLWKRSLGAEQTDANAEKVRRRLIVSLDDLREKAVLLAKEIARDLPDFTVHDESHFDALWGLADDIAGDGVTLTPPEAYIFGCAAMIHDLGMATAAFIDGIDSVRREPRWSDSVAHILRERLGRAPTQEEIGSPDSEVSTLALREVLRTLHAENAERLAEATFTSDGEHHTLLDDSTLRSSYGRVIGRVAHSHWWSVATLGDRFQHPLGAPAGYPPDWTVRPLIAACLLRLADASHIDASRAPRFLRALRNPGPEALPHWQFQGHLSQPYPKEDRFVFTGTAFEPEEAEAWWLCADVLTVLDRELRSVDALLGDSGIERFAVRGVAAVEDPERLAALIPTNGWTPVDARVGVSDVVRLVERLGGRELYGDVPFVPLRELLQNAADSVRARRALDDRATDWGQIVTRLSIGPDGTHWLEVDDSGVGMSARVLTDNLLDFGRSFWESGAVLEELPGLLGSGFSPVGRFGIGFFSAFMWSGEVAVVSRRFDAGRAETNVLEFTNGVGQRPLLRPASIEERLGNPGTCVRARVDEETLHELGLRPGNAMEALLRICRWLAPALGVDLYVEAAGVRELAVAANDWLEIPIENLGDRVRSAPGLLGTDPDLDDEEGEFDDLSDEDDELELDDEGIAAGAGGSEGEFGADVFGTNVRELIGLDGAVVGRLALNPNDLGGVVTVGGLRATSLKEVVGVLEGQPITASRQSGVPIASPEALAAWASEQAGLIDIGLPAEKLLEAANVIWRCGGDPAPLPILIAKEGPMSPDEAAAWIGGLDELILLQDAAYFVDIQAYGDLELFDHVALVPMVPVRILASGNPDGHPVGGKVWPPPRAIAGLSFHEANALQGAVIEICADVWGGWEREESEAEDWGTAPRVGRREGQEVVLGCTLLRRPA